ncbi:putative integrase core domain protein [Trichinella spiralis]|uniref:putative integrase core domain protein n=1 Tax=Trichinella spiralis TaxID=6334 RepID=UPI0001EFEB1C|nr:putative integrase core domain protein [Trichinella spiralis]
MLRDRLVCGLRDEAVQLRLFAKKVLTFQMAQEEALSAEATCKHACEIHAVNVDLSAPNIHHMSSKRQTYISKQRRSKPQAKTNAISVADTHQSYLLNRITCRSTPSLRSLKLSIFLSTEGSDVTIISEQTFEELRNNNKKLKLAPTTLSHVSFLGKQVKLMGSCFVNVDYLIIHTRLRIFVEKGNCPNLLGLEWLKPLGIRIEGINHINSSPVESVLRKYQAVVTPDLGCYAGEPVSLDLDPSVPPVRMKARKVPLALKEKIDMELDKLVKQKVLEPVSHPVWATPIVTPMKPDGSVRICGDYKCTINKALLKHAYPVPAVNHLLASLADAQTIITHRGAFRVKRLQFGVSAAPGIFQGVTDQLTKGIPGVLPYSDDMFIAAKDESMLAKRLAHHKPLLEIFAPNKETPYILSLRMLRWTVMLGAYVYDICYRPRKLIANADILSRLPTKIPDVEIPPPLEVLMLESDDTVIMKDNDIARMSLKDPVISRVLNWAWKGWPAKLSDKKFKPFFIRQLEISVHKGCLLWGNGVAIPIQARSRLLTMLHDGHPGIVRMKALARSYFWWPKMDEEIEKTVNTCDVCQSSRAAMPKAPVHSWETPNNPWSRLHIDFAGPFQEKTFLIVVDAFSKWLEVIPISEMSTRTVIEELRQLFATHGLPNTIMSDNAAQFVSVEFQQFLKRGAIRHARIAPFHPASNGQAERMVRTTKEALRKMRRLRTVLNRIHPDIEEEAIEGNRDVTRSDKQKIRIFAPDDLVFARNYAHGPKWCPATIVAPTGPVSYKKLEGADVSDRDLEIYMNLLEKLREDFKYKKSPLRSVWISMLNCFSNVKASPNISALLLLI